MINVNLLPQNLNPAELLALERLQLSAPLRLPDSPGCGFFVPY